MTKAYKCLLILFSSVILFSFSLDSKQSDLSVSRVFETVKVQYKGMLNTAKNLAYYPRTTNTDGKIKFVKINDWTGGFWPGSLWYMYEFTKDDFWKNNAIKWTRSLESNQYNTSNHDLGFMMFNSYGNALRVTHDTAAYAPVIIQSAKSLISRYSETVGSIKSWDNRKPTIENGTVWKFPVIIDNLMNLELLFSASKLTNNPVYREIAIKHAETTMKNHIRPDYSSFHMVNYDEHTGKVLDRKSVQGFSDNSQWSRGQAWGVYGFTVVYRETKDLRSLVTAQKMAGYYLNNPGLPEDKIPFWDFNVGDKGFKPEWNFNPDEFQPIPRDASAAAIMASALLELSTYSEDSLRTKYFKAAKSMLISLSSPEYLASPNTNNHFILKNSVGNMQKKSEVNVPLIYADYYFLEALLRYKKQSNQHLN